jgi:hypothetical protein
MLIKHGNLLVSLVMESILIQNSVERADVVVIGIAYWEFAAGDIDIMSFLLVSPL